MPVINMGERERQRERGRGREGERKRAGGRESVLLTPPILFS